MDQFINSTDEVVTEAIDGLLRTGEGRLARLDGYPHLKVVVRTDHDPEQVAVISGGGSGHEPAHAGFVGAGMLTAAVCGEIFASPSVDAVLAGILAVTGEGGCLLVVKNYTGDRLNFGLAAERARARGLDVEMVIVEDDIALPDLAQPRGIAGTVLVHKVAGALAADGADLAAVAAAAREVAEGVASLGMSLDTGTVPGSPKEERIEPGKAELGLGIHGEPGVDQIDYDGARAAMETVIERLQPTLETGPCAVLLNNLGGSTPLEMAVLADELARAAQGRLRLLVGPAPLMTSLDMRGFSLSVLPLTEQIEQALRREVGPPAWPGCHEVGEVAVVDVPDGLEPERAPASGDPRTRAVIETVCRVLVDARSDLNALDAKSGDGDTGSTLAGAAQALQERLDDLPLADAEECLRALSAEMTQSMGGSSGVLLAIFFAAAADAAAETDVTAALRAGLERVEEVGGAIPGDRTMIDALDPALRALPDGIDAAARAAREGADGTAEMGSAGAGRAQYVGQAHLSGHVDPGAEAVARVLEGLAAEQAG